MQMAQMYLYNGVKLPALPEWDKEMYPYAWLLDCGRVSWSNFRVYELYVLGKPSTRDEWGILSLPAPWNKYDLNVFDDERITEWEVGSPCYIDHHLTAYPIWTNHDILNEDGSLYLAASDPVPVTSAQPIDPNSMLAGYLVGCRLRSMRGK